MRGRTPQDVGEEPARSGQLRLELDWRKQVEEAMRVAMSADEPAGAGQRAQARGIEVAWAAQPGRGHEQHGLHAARAYPGQDSVDDRLVAVVEGEDYPRAACGIVRVEDRAEAREQVDLGGEFRFPDPVTKSVAAVDGDVADAVVHQRDYVPPPHAPSPSLVCAPHDLPAERTVRRSPGEGEGACGGGT